MRYQEEMKSRTVTLDIAPAALGKLFLTVFGIWVLIQIWPVIVLAGLALMLVATFSPMVRALQDRVPKHWAIVLILTSVAALVIGAAALILPVLERQVLSLITHFPAYTRSVQQVLGHHHIHFNVSDRIDQASAALTAQIPAWLAAASQLVLDALTVMVLTLYMLLEREALELSALRLLPRRRRLEARRVLAGISHQIGGYVRGQLITSLLAGLFTLALLSALDVPEALALSVWTAIADAVPMIGLLLAVIPAALMALTVSASTALTVLLAQGAYHLLETHVIAPRVYGRLLGLSCTVIVLSFLIGGQLMGLVGALVALPLAAALPSVLDFVQTCRGEEESDSPLPLPG